jgi:hypothetical protein
MTYICWSITISSNCCVLVLLLLLQLTIWRDLSRATLELHISTYTENRGDVFGLQAARHVETHSACDHLYFNAGGVLDVVTLLPGKCNPDSLSTHCLDWLQALMPNHNQRSSKMYWWVPAAWRYLRLLCQRSIWPCVVLEVTVPKVNLTMCDNSLQSRSCKTNPTLQSCCTRVIHVRT